ncbi:heparinase II/III family protein [Paenibacillus sp. G2S3]|uniref:CBM96 family carbohydrate-binding protein n=1 Tax=Paenibacillus sp. G2S3 TaxID=3047872 RepID=UPI0024C10123|nr:heparinase II/III family protein [Paenibacillus sp. G2S3]WHY19872.1 heparinase II/III family protein [Paenibacillus sp. G2S3]
MRNLLNLQKKRTSCLLITLIVFTQTLLTLFAEPQTVSASSGVSNMSDASFFGVWDQAQQRWNTPSKLDYDGFPGLSSVESAVKAGNYEQAKSDMLEYFKNRTNRKVPTVFGSNPAMVPLLMDQIVTPLKEYYLGTITVEPVSAVYSMNILSTVQSALGSDLSFMLIGRYKGTNQANIYSLEQDCSLTTLTQCRPTLEIQYSDATGVHTVNLTSTKDTYIRGNDTAIHASETLLQVQESGAPYDSNTRKAYLNFDLSSIKGTVTAATLKLSGYSELDKSTDVMIYKSGDTAWDENLLTYANHNGKTFSWQGLSSGTDWAGPTPNIADIEYHYQITRFSWLNPLLAEYLNTGTESFAAKYIDYMVDFIVDGEASTSEYGAGSFPRNFDAGIRSASWVKAYHVLRESSSMSAESNIDILKTFWKKGTYLNSPGGFSPVGNHGMVETEGLYTLGLYFPEFTDSATWLSTAYSRFDYLMSTLIFKDGSYSESSDTYTTVTTAPMIAIKQLGVMNNVPFEGSFDSNLNSLGKYLADIAFPNGYAVNFGDSQYTDLKATIKQIGELTDDDALRYIGTSGAQGTEPSYTSILYPVSKSAMMRSGWSPNDRYLFTNVKQAAPHRHPDDNSITYYAYGRPLLVDPGTYSYSNDSISNWLRYSTEAHNTIEINDTPQNLTEGWMQDWTDNSKFNFVSGVTQNVPGFKHSRDTLFLKSSFSIVSDVVQAPLGTNKYQQTWHFLPTANPALDASTQKVSTVFNDTYGDIQVVPADHEQITATLDNGYYSNAFYSVSNSTYASFTKTVSGDTTFDTVLYPTASGEDRDIKVTRMALSVPTTVASSLKIENVGDADTSGYYYVSHEDNPRFRRNFDTFSFDGKLAYVEKTSSGKVTSAILKSGSTLEHSEANLIASKMPVNDIAVDWNGTTLEITGSNLVAANDPNAVSAVAIRAFGATSVKLNGSLISDFTVSDGYIYAVGVPSWSSSSEYLNSFDLGVGHSGVQSIEFDLIPTADQVGAVIGYTGQSSAVSSESDLPMLLRLNSEGYFDVRNGNSFEQKEKLNYKANELYHVTLLADLDSKAYNVYIAPQGKPEIQIADHFAFLTGAPDLMDIGKLVMNSPVDDQLRINNHTVGLPDFIELDVNSDAYVWAANPTTNYGTGKKLEVRNSTSSSVFRHSYLRFDLGDLPSDLTSFTAKLRLTSASAGTFTDQAQFVQDDSWGETSINYNNKPAGGALLGEWSMPSAENSVELNISSQFNTELVGDKKLSVVITSQTKNNVSHYYYSKENGGGKPKIVIYTK